MTVAAPPRPGKRVRWIVAAAVAVAAAVLVLGLAARSTGQGAYRRVQCANNLKTIASIVQERRVSRSWPGSGPDAGLEELTKLGVSLGRAVESACLCPMDEEGRSVAEERFYSSYVVRDFARCPLPKTWTEKSPLLVCLHHPGHAFVAFDNSSVVFLDRAALGLGENDPIETGPDSKSEVLRAFPARPAR